MSTAGFRCELCRIDFFKKDQNYIWAGNSYQTLHLPRVLKAKTLKFRIVIIKLIDAPPFSSYMGSLMIFQNKRGHSQEQLTVLKMLNINTI